MTDTSAAELEHEERPRLHARALLELGALAQKALESFGVHEEILPSDQAKE